jgi:predicted O-linked N-acetylglucosamine transferase (SPINDLY family)
LNQPAASLPYFKAAVEASPNQGQYWKRYIDALIQADQIDVARDMLEQGRQQGLQGEELDSLIVRLGDVAQSAEQTINTHDTVLQNSKKKNKTKPDKSAKKLAQNKGINPSSQEINTLVTLLSKRRYTEALTLAQNMTIRFPQHGFGWKVLGALFQQMGRSTDALNPMQKAAALSPDDAETYSNLGAILKDMGRSDEAVHSYRRALEIKPDYAPAHFNLGIALSDLGRQDEADLSYRRALEIKPDYAEAHNNLGLILNKLGRLKEAEACYLRALEINSDYMEAHTNLGNTLIDMGRMDEAEVSYRRALGIKPDFAEGYHNLLCSLSYNGTVDAKTLFYEHRRFGEQIERSFRSHCLQHTNSPNPGRALQIGFVSGDFWNHAVASFIESVLAHLSNYPQLSLHAYYNNDIEDAITQRIKGHFDYWHPIVGLDDATLTEKIRADNIDILIDLSGHTAKNRLLVFARKPAPVQASWIGYPGTTGLQAIDYYLADRFFLPDEYFRAQFTEKIVYLPAIVSFTPANEAPSVNALPALSNGFVTFGSFNRLSKLNPRVIALWSQLLRALPESKIVLGAMPQDGYDVLIDWFAQEGIAPERLSFHPKCGMGAYLALHHQVDIGLDTFPYNGGTTTCHALWMGVPTLTLAGKTPASRDGATLHSHVGLEGFIAYDEDDFVKKGMNWVNDVEALAQIRSGLRTRFEQSAMGQPALIAEGLQQALRIMWQRWCDGLSPAELDVSNAQINRAMHQDDK